MPRGTDSQAESQSIGLARSAFGEYHDALHAFLVRRLRNAHDASDALQEVFLRLLRIERSELVRSPQAYLYGIASHVVREFRMRSRRDQAMRDRHSAEAQGDRPERFGPDDLANALNAERQLEKALAKLSPAELRILVYDRCDGLSHDEIARKMGLSAHTVKKYFFRALATLRTSMDHTGRAD